MEWILNFSTPSSLYRIFTRMNTSLFLMLFWGWLITILCVLVLIRRDTFIKLYENQQKDGSYMILAGFINLILWLATVFLVWVWRHMFDVLDFVVMILGWIALIKWILLIGFPETFLRWNTPMLKNQFFMTILLSIGIFLGICLIILWFLIWSFEFGRLM